MKNARWKQTKNQAFIGYIFFESKVIDFYCDHDHGLILKIENPNRANVLMKWNAVKNRDFG